MDEIEEIDNYSIITDYDDGVVCFGKVTQSQIERQKRLPRHTILPSDIQLSESFLNPIEDDEDDENDETLSENQNKSAFVEDKVEDEMVGDVDVQEAELSINNFKYNETNSSTPCVSNVNELSMTNHEISDSAGNVCTLKHCSQQEDEDISYYCDSELGDLENFDEYSIVPDEFSITPGKQRLFDTRLGKSLSHAKTVEISQAINISNVAVQTFDNEKSVSIMSNKIFPTEDVKSYNNEESEAIEVDIKSINLSVVDKTFDETLCTSLLFSNDKSKVLDNLSSDISQTKDTSNIAEQSFDDEKSMNTMSNIIVPTADINDHNNEEESDTKEVNIKSNIGVVDNILDETMCTSLLFSNDTCKVLDNSSHKINQTKDISNVSKQCFDDEKSTNSTSNIIDPIADAKKVSTKSNVGVSDDILNETMCTSLLFPNNKSKVFDNSSNEISLAKDTTTAVEQSFNNEKSMKTTSNIIALSVDVKDNNIKESETMEEDIESTNLSVVDKIFDETMGTSLLFSNDQSKVLDNSSSDISQTKDTSNVVKQCFDNDKSMNTTSNTIVSIVDAKKVSMKSNVGVVDDILDETMCTSLLFPNNKSKVFDNSLNEISLAKDTSTAVEQSFNNEKSMKTTSNIIAFSVDVKDYNIKESETMEVDIESTNLSVVDKIFDETMGTSLLFSNDQSEVLDNSSSDINQTKNTSNVAKQSFDDEKSMITMSNIIVLTADINDHNNEEESDAKEVNIKSNIGVVDNILDETMCTSLLYSKDKSKVFDISSSEISQAKNTLIVAEQSEISLDTSIVTGESLDNEKSMNIKFNISTTGVVDFNLDVESDAKEVDIKSFNTSVGDKMHDETMCNSMLSTHDNLNAAEQCFDSDKSVCETSNIMTDINSYNKEEQPEAMEVDIKSTNTSVVKNILDETMCTSLLFANGKSKDFDKSSNETNLVKCSLNVTEQSLAVRKSLENIIVLSPNVNDTLLLDEFRNNTIKHSVDIEMSCSKNVDNVLTNDISGSNENTLEDLPREMTQCLEFEQTIHNTCNDISSENDDTHLNKSYIFGNQSLKNVSVIEQTLCSDLSTSLKDDTNSSIDCISKPNLSAIIENRTLEDNCEMVQDENFENSIYDLSNVSVSKYNNKIQDNEKLNKPTNQNKIESFSENILKSELNVIDSNIEVENNGIISNNTLDEELDKSDEITEKTNSVISSDKGVGSGLLSDEQIVTDEYSNSLNKTIEQTTLELSSTSESKQNNYFNQSINETTGTQYQSACLLNTTLNQSIKKSDFTEITTDRNKQLNSYSCAIKDFSIIEQQTIKSPELKTNIISSPIESHWNISNLIEMSVVSKIDLKSNDQTLVSSYNPFEVAYTNNESEKSITSSSDEIMNSATNIEKPMFSYNSEILTDVQINDVTLMESSKKSLIEESGDGNESNQQKGNKRKLELDQEQQNYEKKMKIEIDDQKTPVSTLYKFRNMYKSSEKSLIYKSNTKENELKSDKCHQKLNFSKFEENKNESCFKKTEVLVKSKIPCKINDRSMSKNCELNNSSLSLSDCVKQKRIIPRLIGTPVLSDLSNSSMRKCPESRIPSTLKK